jgi:uncharacterized phosphosugar-binding protein
MSDNVTYRLFESVRSILDRVEQTQGPALQEAVDLTVESLINGGIIHVFGTGHSHMLAEEIFFRAGGITQVNAILDPGLMLQLSAQGSTALERLEGYAEIVLQRYTLRAGDIMFLISNSGRNAVPIEAADYARQQGLKVIGLTSASTYKHVPSRHSSGKKLPDVVDVVIDTCVPEGDAALSLPGLSARMGSMSTIIGASLMQAYICETASALLARGHQPKVIISANVQSQQDHTALFAEYTDRIRHK